jgi:hypothetical protein
MKKIDSFRKPCAKSHTVLFLVVLVVGIFMTSCQTTNFVVSSSALCNCSAGVDDDCFTVGENWRYTVDNLMEVSATDFKRGNYVGPECQGEASWWRNSWRPVDGYKYSMSGRLDHFNWNYDDDEDWNLHVIPNPAFSWLISDVEALHSESVNDHLKCGNTPCMEAEVSPDKQFWSNPWFFAPGADPADTDDNGFSWLEGRQMGFYGVWIMDAAHDFKAEIHPSEMMWFRDQFSAGDVFWLLFTQDNTGRFDDRDNFDCDGPAPAGWEPWTQSPRSGQFNIAFEVDPAGEAVTFTIVELFKRFVVTSEDASARFDADNGKSHALEFNGRIVVRVQEDQPNDNDLGVRFTNLCLQPNGKLRGFVSIRTMIGGDDDRDEEGFHILYVFRSRGDTRPSEPLKARKFPRLLITSSEVAGSLKRDKNYFTGDVKLDLHGNDSTTISDYAITKVEFAGKDGRQQISYEQNKEARVALVRNVPLIDGRLVVTTASGLVEVVPVAALESLALISDTVIRSVPDDDASRFLLRTMGVAADTSSRMKNLMRHQEMHLKLDTRYAELKGGKRSDKTSSFADEINDAIVKNDRKKLDEFFKSDPPSTISWTFEAVNLETGQPVVVNTDKKQRSEGIQVEMMSAKMKNDSIRIQFLSPGSQGIVELRAKATLTDVNGKTSTEEHQVWSHGFSPITSVREATDLVQSLTRLKDSAVFIPPSTDRKSADDGLSSDAKARHSRIVNGYVKEIVRDDQFTIGELKRMVTTLKKFGLME